MAREYFLVPYRIRLRQRYHTDYLNLSGLGEADVDVLEVVKQFFIKLAQQADDDTAQEIIVQADGETLKQSKSYRRIHGVIHTGQYGIESVLHNRRTGDRFVRTREHAEVLPFYFLIHIPLGKPAGFMIVMRQAQKGIRKILVTALEKHMKSYFSGDFVVEINPYVIDKEAKLYSESVRAKKIRLIRYEKHRDRSVKVEKGDSGVFGLVPRYTEVVLAPPKNSWFPIGADKGYTPSDFYELIDMPLGDFQPTAVRLEVELGNKTRTVDLSNVAKLRTMRDISEHVNFDGNRLIAEPVHQEALRLLEELTNQESAYQPYERKSQRKKNS